MRIHPTIFSDISHGDITPDEFDFATFRKFAQNAEIPEQREIAARRLPEVLRRIENAFENGRELAISGTIDEVYSECLFLLEELLCDVDNVQTAALEQIKEVFIELRKASPTLLEQAVSNFPPLITRSLGYSNRVRLRQRNRMQN